MIFSCNTKANFLYLMVGFVMSLTACGDETTQVVQEIPVVKSVSALPECRADDEGLQMLVKGELTARICVDGEWLSLTEQDGDTVYVDEGVQKVYISEQVSCETKKLSNGSGIKVICNGDSIGVILNGRDGNDGNDGAAGKNGTDGEDGTDGENKTGKQGSDGKNGIDGVDGVSCSLRDAVDSVVIQCGADSASFYKAMCGLNPYNPETHFCVDKVVYSKCGGLVYDHESQFCGADSVVAKCGGLEYDVGRFLCTDDEILPKCSMGEWNPETELCDERDGRVYRIVTIGNQTWMAENLKFEYKVNGSVYGTYCYNNDCKSDSSKIYGRYYTWAAAMDSAGIFDAYGEGPDFIVGKGCGFGLVCNPKYIMWDNVPGICPKGWHLPSEREWMIVTREIGDYLKMQAKGFAAWPEAQDSVGFSVVPAGVFVGDYAGTQPSGKSTPPKDITSEGFTYGGYAARIWSSTDRDCYRALYWFLGPFNGGSMQGNYYFGKDSGLSVRCVKDDPI